MSQVPAGHYECRTPVSSRRLCYDVPLYSHEAQRRGLAFHLPHHPLPVGHLIGREPLRSIGLGCSPETDTSCGLTQSLYGCEL